MPADASGRRHPVRLVVRDELDRRRLTVLFRLVLAIPHLVWLSIYATAAIVIAFVTWLFVLVLGRVPKSLHRFLANYTRYTAHLLAYLWLRGRSLTPASAATGATRSNRDRPAGEAAAARGRGAPRARDPRLRAFVGARRDGRVRGPCRARGGGS